MAASILLTAVLGVGAALAAHRAAARVDRGPATSAWNGEARLGTTSTVARRLYEEGQRAHYRGDARGAYRLFAAALEEDSTFALAAYYAGVNRRRFDPGESAEHPSAITLVQRGVRLAERAPERDRLTIELEQARAERARYAAIAESLAARFPAEPIGHLALASVRFTAGDFLSAAAHARRAVAADSVGQHAGCHSCDALEIIINAYVYADSLTAAERVARDLIRLRPGTAYGWNQLHLVLARQGRRTEAMAAYRHAEALEPSAVDGWTPVRVALLVDDYADADEFISLRQRLAGTTSGSQWWQVISLRNQGRHVEALATAGQLSRVDAASGRLSVAQVLFEMGHYRDAARRFEALARAAPGSAEDDPGMRARHVSWMLTHAATAWHASGDTLRLHALADTVESIAHLSAYGRDWRLPSHIRGLLSRARGDDRQAAAEFRAALFSPGEGFTRTNLELARTLLSLGNPEEAVSVLQPALRGSVDGANFYATRTELHELLARAFDLGGRADSALAHRNLAARARTAGRIDLPLACCALNREAPARQVGAAGGRDGLAEEAHSSRLTAGSGGECFRRAAEGAGSSARDGRAVTSARGSACAP